MARMTRQVHAVLVVALLALGVLSGPAWARVAGGAKPAASEEKAPKVTKQPVSVTVEEGHGAVFEATASGAPAPTVRWEVSTNGGGTWSTVTGATTSRLEIASANTSESGAEYRAVFTNVVGSATSKAATLTVQLAPAVTKQPASVTVESGQSAVFEAIVAGSPTPTAQWELSTNGGGTWSTVSGATSDRLEIASAKTSENGYEYRVALKNVAGQATSQAATLTVHNVPRIVAQPTSTTVEEGHTAIFNVAATGFPTPTVQWEVSTDEGATWSALGGASTSTLSLADVQGSQNGYEYRAVLENVAGTATSTAATLTVHTRPAVTEQPLSTTVEVGQPALFEAAASGFPAPTVQWELSTNAGGTWSPVAGATADQLTVADAQASENGDEYRAVFTNVAGKGTSQAATLTVATHHYRVLDWGQNTYGQLGDDGFAQSDVPVSADGLNFVTSVAAGRRHTLALLTNESADAWGSNMAGQLGNGGGSLSTVPVPVEGLKGVKALAAGANHSLALLSDGTVVAWGGNESGQLGNGGTLESDVPVHVIGLSGVTAIAAGNEYSLALLGDGTMMAWGANEQGQLGDEKTKDSDVPVAVSALTGVTAIAAGGEHALALLSGGTVMAWGADEYGQLGNSSVLAGGEEGEEGPRFSDSPVAVAGVSGVTAIAAGLHHSLALLSGGTVMAWGEDAAGELGDGGIAREEETPAPVSGLTGATAIAAGGEHSMALLSSGNVDTWGEDKFGELGNGTAGEPSDVPVAVTGLGEVKAIAAGASHDVALSEPLPSVTAVAPRKGQAAGGTTVTIVGSSIEGATSVAFGAHGATHFTVTSPSSITATAPPGALGTVHVTVTTPSGTSAPSSADLFSYVAAPTVKSLSAKRGPGAGETSVTITGTNFEEATVVDFGATPAAHFTVNSSTSITALSPAGAGTVDVTVTAPGGTSATSKKDQFEYVPAIEGISPSAGPAAGGTSVTIIGTGFALGGSATTFKFGKKYATSVDCTSSTSCTAVSPLGKAGTVDVIAAVGKAKSATSPPADHFTYE
jgi:alpha-tubulin suppressor-like RCC1 family protein